MSNRDELILMIEEYEDAICIRLVDKRGKVFSYHYFDEYPDIAELRIAIGSATVSGDYNRVIYSINFKTIWDYKANLHIFGEFVEEIFASQYHSNLYDSSDFKYYCFEQFGEFLEEYKTKGSKRDDPFAGMGTTISSDEDLPF